jgi:pimeloyl-ACP methyl ester carboxylesterase
VITREHRVDVGEGVRLHVVERRMSDERPRRAMLLIPATLVTHALYDAVIDGDASYSAMDRVSRAGYAAFTVDYEGYGKSTAPADGATVTFARCLHHMGRVVEWIRATTDLPRVDLLGTSVGSDIAVVLGSEGSPIEPSAVGRVILTAMTYRRFSELVEREAFSPQFESVLRGMPEGVLETQAPFYDLVTSEVDEPVRRWAHATFPGRYATGPTLAAFSLPLIDGAAARAPALLAWGARDPVTPRADALALLEDYAAPIELLELAEGGHSPFLEPHRETFWSAALSFLDRGYEDGRA